MSKESKMNDLKGKRQEFSNVIEGIRNLRAKQETMSSSLKQLKGEIKTELKGKMKHFQIMF